MRVADAIFDRLKSEVDTVFYLPGGGSGPLVDALGQSGLRAFCCLHEQGAGYAAVGYAQHRGFGVCLVTSGPGVTNAMTPCLAAWLDSVPVLFISGQVMVKWLAAPGMRSRGTQEGPTIRLVGPITKRVWQVGMVSPDEDVIETLDILISAAKSDRQGPVWLDVPMDVQAADVQPVILIGNGIRGDADLLAYLLGLGIPVLTTWMAADLVPEDHPAFCGRPGIFGQRAANIIQQKATHLYCYGARLDGEQVAYDYDRFAPNAIKFVHDIDRAELTKLPASWGKVNGNTGFAPIPDPFSFDWLAWCRDLYARFRPELDGLEEGGRLMDPFTFTRLLGEHSAPDDVFAIGSSGNAPTVFFQAYKVKKGQRISNVCTIGAMGADIPMAMGAALATGRRTICVTGDGGFAMNAQELETIRRLQLPLIFFVMNNNGYNSIRVAQKARFGRVTGADPKSGLTLPSIEEITHAYRLAYMPMRYLTDFPNSLAFSPMVVEVFVDPEWQQLPRVMASGTPIRADNMEDMTPKIDDLAELMAWDGETVQERI